jgi:transposase
MAVELRKSTVVAEINKGGSVKAITERLGITTAMLKKAVNHFNKGLTKEDPRYINLRRKPKEELTFVDDTTGKSCGEAYEQDQVVSERSTVTMLD